MKISLSYGKAMPAFSKFIGQVGSQARFAAAKSLTNTAKSVKTATEGRMAVRFNDPTRWTLNSLYSTKATKQTLSARIGVKDTGAGGRRAPVKWLTPGYAGVERKHKAFERAMAAAGMMPAGWFAVPGGGAKSFDGAMDAHGNLRSQFLTLLLRYFKAFPVGGYKKNLTDRARKNRAKESTTNAGQRLINGWVFFISNGTGKARHFRPGIWAKRGVNGREVTQLIAFRPSISDYDQRIDLHEEARHLMRSEFPARFADEFKKAMATAR